MQDFKKWAAGLLALALAMGALAGCSGKQDAPSGVSSSEAVSSQAEGSSQASSGEESSASSAASGAETTMSGEYGEGLTETGYFEGVTALDYVTLPDYAKMEIPKDVSEVNDEKLLAELDGMAAEYTSTQQVKDRAVQDGDTVNIDYVGSVDGVEFAGGNTQGNGTTVTIGVTSYIDDFLEQLIGHKPGETFDVNVTFPDPYENNTALSGKDAVFVTTVNFIQEEKTPELNDEFVREHWEESDGWTTLDQMKEAVRENMRREAVADYLWGQITEQAKITEVPAAIQGYHEKAVQRYCQIMADQYSMELEDFISQYMNAENMDALLEDNATAIGENAKNSLLLQALAEDMGYEVTQEAFDGYMADDVGAADYTDLVNFYGKPYLLMRAREELVKRELAR